MRLSVSPQSAKFGWSAVSVPTRARPHWLCACSDPALTLTITGYHRYPSWASMRIGMPAEPSGPVSCGRYLRIPAPRQDMCPVRARDSGLTREGF